MTYLDSLIWVRVPWTPIGKALRAIFVRNKALVKAYINLAETTGELSFALLQFSVQVSGGVKASIQSWIGFVTLDLLSKLFTT